jgi:glycosyltransferase involved in cell wall biosynthesis
MKLSIIIPAYNEAATIGNICEKVRQVTLIDGFEKEVIVVNDASSDNTEEAIFAYQELHPDLLIRYFKHEINRGKGAALHTGIRGATGDYIIVQDADLEYDPQEFNLLLKPVVDGFADVVYGSRFAGGNAHRVLFFWHTIGNRLLTFLSNISTNLNISDMETCYKLFRADIIKSLDLRENRFGFEPEVTAKIAGVPNVRVYEVGISYYGRTYQEGKKINWKDGLRAIYCVIKYGVKVRRLALLLVLAMVLLFALALNGAIIKRETVWLGAHGRTEEALYEARLKPLKELLPEHGVIGYVTDEGAEISKKWKDFYLAQYILSPRVLVKDTRLPYVMGGYYDIREPNRSASEGLVLIKDFGHGIQLYKGKQ